MDRNEAQKQIESIFARYRKAASGQSSRQQRALMRALSLGKLYELFVLAHLLERLQKRGFSINFKGKSLRFKSSPGMIKATDSHFELAPPNSTQSFWIFVDIEFETLGQSRGRGTDRSGRHEIDIVVTSVNSGFPKHSDVLLGVECKAAAQFKKHIVKEVLGVRRELSLLRDPQLSELSHSLGRHCHSPVYVEAEPRSEFLLAYTDPRGNSYRQSPKRFGIAFWHLQP